MIHEQVVLCISSDCIRMIYAGLGFCDGLFFVIFVFSGSLLICFFWALKRFNNEQLNCEQWFFVMLYDVQRSKVLSSKTLK